jgi:hypothetical protein
MSFVMLYVTFLHLVGSAMDRMQYVICHVVCYFSAFEV